MNKNEKRFSSEAVIERIEASVKQLGDVAREQARRFEERAKANPWVERVTSGELRRTLDERIGTIRGQVLDAVGVASKEQLDKLTKKLESLSKRLGELGKKNAA